MINLNKKNQPILLNRRFIKYLSFTIILISNFNCTEEKVHYLFDKKELFKYEYTLRDKKGTTDLRITYNEDLSKKMSKVCYNFKSNFLVGFVYKEGQKIYFINNKETFNSILFDFSERIGDSHSLCLSSDYCYNFFLDSIYDDKKYSNKTFIYKLQKNKTVNDNDLDISSHRKIERIYVNENIGIIKYIEISGLGVAKYELIH